MERLNCIPETSRELERPDLILKGNARETQYLYSEAATRDDEEGGLKEEVWKTEKMNQNRIASLVNRSSKSIGEKVSEVSEVS